MSFLCFDVLASWKVSATSGPARKILVRHLGDADIGTLFIFDLRRQADEIWTSHLLDRTLVLGINMKAAYIHDIERPLQLQYLHTQSDVFAVHQHQNVSLFHLPPPISNLLIIIFAIPASRILSSPAPGTARYISSIDAWTNHTARNSSMAD